MKDFVRIHQAPIIPRNKGNNKPRKHFCKCVCWRSPLPLELTRFSSSQRAASEQSWASLRVKWLEGTSSVYLCGHLLVTPLISAPVGAKAWRNESVGGYMAQTLETLKDNDTHFGCPRAAVLAHPNPSSHSAAANTPMATGNMDPRWSECTHVCMCSLLPVVCGWPFQTALPVQVGAHGKHQGLHSKLQKCPNTQQGISAALWNTEHFKWPLESLREARLPPPFASKNQPSTTTDFVPEKGTETCLMVQMWRFGNTLTVECCFPLTNSIWAVQSKKGISSLTSSAPLSHILNPVLTASRISWNTVGSYKTKHDTKRSYSTSKSLNHNR